ncbi:hypothetical protein [Brachyspira alvinipulli]|nr:hypothetical protein [Brachyspira alvinipulli]
MMITAAEEQLIEITMMIDIQPEDVQKAVYSADLETLLIKQL